MALRVMSFWRSGRRHNACMNVGPQVAPKDVGANAVFNKVDEDEDEDDEASETIYAMPFPNIEARSLGGARVTRTWAPQDFARVSRRSYYVDRSEVEKENLTIGGSNSGALPPRRLSFAQGSDAVKLSLEVQSTALAHYVDLQTKCETRGSMLFKACRIKDRKTVAVKLWDKKKLSSFEKQKLVSEVATLRKVQGVPHVIRLEDYHCDNRVEIIELEYCTGGTLLEYSCFNGGKLPENVVLAMCVKPLLQCLAGLHSLGIIHRDLKPEHLLLVRNNDLRLIDFGTAIDTNVDVPNYYCGTLEYMAPEVASKMQPGDVFHKVLQEGMDERDLPQYDSKADIWSLGVIALELLTSQQPFIAETPVEMAAQMARQYGERDSSGNCSDLPPFLAKHASEFSAECLSFINNCLQRDPQKRLTAPELLIHPWVTRANVAHVRTSIELQTRIGRR